MQIMLNVCTYAGDEWLPGIVTGLPSIPVLKVTTGDSHTMALTNDGVIYSWGAYRDSSGMLG